MIYCRFHKLSQLQISLDMEILALQGKQNKGVQMEMRLLYLSSTISKQFKFFVKYYPIIQVFQQSVRLGGVMSSVDAGADQDGAWSRQLVGGRRRMSAVLGECSVGRVQWSQWRPCIPALQQQQLHPPQPTPRPVTAPHILSRK